MVVGKLFCKSRNVTGKINLRRKSTFLKKSFVLVDYSRRWTKQIGLCVQIVKDPHRTCMVALLKYSDGTYSYILSPSKLKLGTFLFTTMVISNFYLKYVIGCCVLIRYLTYTSVFFNIEMTLGKGGKYSRSAGTFCTLIYLDFDKDTARIQLPSGAVKTISIYSLTTIGRASNKTHNRERFVKAGYSRRLGVRPVVRGVARNPVDHPHGGRTKTNSPEVTPWNKIAKHGK